MGVMECLYVRREGKVEERTVLLILVFSRSLSVQMLGEIRSWTLRANLYEEACSMAMQTTDHGVGAEWDGFLWVVGKRASWER